MQDFTTKSAALFACLDDAQTMLKGTALDQSNTNSDYLLSVPKSGGRKSISHGPPGESLNRLRGKESLFKKPELPLSRCLKPRKLPDYQMNPHKWKKYSLSDVDISDQTNTAAAFTFLKQMEDQLEENTVRHCNEKCEVDAKIEFKRSSKIRRNLKALAANEMADVEVDKPKLRGSKLVMPEYVIGQKSTARRQKKPNVLEDKSESRAGLGKLTLSHLQEDEEINEEDDTI